MVTKEIFLLLFIQFFILGLGGSIVGPLIPILADNFKVNFNVIGSALSLNAFGILLASLFSGIIAERFGKRNILILGNTLFIISFLGLYFSNHFLYFAVSYIVFGISWGILFVISFSIMGDVYQFSISKAILRLDIGYLSGMFFIPILVSGILFLNINWRYLFLSIAFLNIILLIFILSYKVEGLSNKKNEENFKNLFISSRKLLSNLIIILCGVINFLHFGLGVTFTSWFTTYFNNLDVPVAFSSLILSLYLLIFGLGLFTKSFLVVKLSEKKVILYFLILAFIFLFLSFIIDLLVIKILFILLFGFSFSGVDIICLSIAIKQNPQHSGSTTSIIVSFGWVGAIIFQYTTGLLIENFSEISLIYNSLVALFLSIIIAIILNYYYKLNRKVG